jgi:hypothetical protein
MDRPTSESFEAGNHLDRPVAEHSWVTWLLALPWIFLAFPFYYSTQNPQVAGFPFFYWYQLLWVLISAVLTYVVYRFTR